MRLFTTASRTRGEAGSAMIMTLMVMALVTALATTVAVVTINNLQGARRAQLAGAALNAAEAGIAQAVSYMRANGVRDLGCAAGPCSGPWGEANPVTDVVSHVDGLSYVVWIEEVVRFRPQAQTDGEYRIHSTGLVSDDPADATPQARRTVVTEVTVDTSEMPRGLFARSINGGGTGQVHRQSIFTTGCVYKRGQIRMEGMDLAYGIPAAVHSSQIITESNGTGQYCSDTRAPIHDPAAANGCNPKYPYDQDSRGRELGSACANAAGVYPRHYGASESTEDGQYGSFIRDDAALFEAFGIKSPALSPAQLEQLRALADTQGNLITDVQSWAGPDDTHAIMYFDLTGAPASKRVVDLNNITNFNRAPDATTCSTKSLIIVVEGGNVRLNANQNLVASVFLTSEAPYGQVLKANGTADFIGTIYADSLDLTGTADIWLDECFLENVSPALLEVEETAYYEDDRHLG